MNSTDNRIQVKATASPEMFAIQQGDDVILVTDKSQLKILIAQLVAVL